MALQKLRILSLSPASGRVGYAYFEGLDLVDWGVKGAVKGSLGDEKSLSLLEVTEALVSSFDPELVLLPEIPSRGKGSGRHGLIRAAKTMVGSTSAELTSYSWTDVQQTFREWITPNRPTKQRVMEILAGLFPELAPLVPKPRRSWEAQDYWLPMFDAVARVVTWVERTDGFPSLRESLV